jgi:hypothetical protein
MEEELRVLRLYEGKEKNFVLPKGIKWKCWESNNEEGGATVY